MNHDESTLDLSLIIACYKDGPHLEDSIIEIENTLAQTNYAYELIIIDDCSPNNSAEVVKQSAQKRHNVTIVLHEKNEGRGATIVEGLKMAQGKYAGFLDIDLEVHCRYIPSMLMALEEGADVATAFRVYEIRWNIDTFLRHILSVNYRKLVQWFLKLPFKDTETGYKFFNRERILPVLDKTKSPGWFWDTEIMAQCYYHDLKVVEIPALFMRRWDKQSTVRPFRDSLIYLKELYRFKRSLKQKNTS